MESRAETNREQYMNSLQKALRRLPKEDRETALEYFEEYFDEAGPENEEQAIHDLGEPQEAANQIIMELAEKSSMELPEAGVKRGLQNVWIGILAVFAAPLAVPLAFAAVALVGALGLTVLLALASLYVGAAGVAAGGALAVVLAAVKLFQSPANAAATIGTGLLCMGAGLALMPVAVAFTKNCLAGMVRLFGRMVSAVTRKE